MADWVFDSLVGFLQSPMWSYPVNNFIDQYCVVFDSEEENKFSYTDTHKEYQTMVEKLLESFLADLGIPPEQFSEVCSKENPFGSMHEHLFEQLLAAEDFLIFKSMMVRKNIDLELQALAMLQKELGHSPQAYQLGGGDSSGEPPKLSGSADEERILQEVLQQSKKEYIFQQSLGGEEMEKLLALAQEESLRLYEAAQREEQEMAEKLERVLQLSASLEETGGGITVSSTTGQEEPTIAEDQTEPSGKQQRASASGEEVAIPESTTEQEEPTTIDSKKTSTAASAEDQTEASGKQRSISASSEEVVIPESSIVPDKSDSLKHPKHTPNQGHDICQASMPLSSPVEKCKPLLPLSPIHQTGSTKSRVKEVSGAEAAKQWVESAKSEFHLEELGPAAGASPKGPDDLKKREIYLRRQRDRLLEMKKKERARQFDSYTASQSSVGAKSTQVARSAVEGKTGGQESERAATGGISKAQGRNTGILCSAIAGQLRKELAQSDS